MNPFWEFVIGIACGAAGMYGVRALVLSLLAARTGSPEPPEIPATVWGSSGPSPSPLVPDRSPAPDPPTVRSPGPVVAPVAAGEPRASATTVGPTAHADADAARPDDSVRLSQRVVVHLFQLGRGDPDEVGHPGATQRGICEALDADQSAVSKALRRLTAAEVVVTERRHIRGGDRRVNVYRLTRRGELLAHEVLSRVRASAPPVPAVAPTASRAGRRAVEWIESR